MKEALKSIVFIVLGSFVGLGLLFLVYCLPTYHMQVHVWQSLPMLEKEFEDSEVITGFPASLTGTFTDCLMLQHSIYRSEEHSLLEQILYMYRGESSMGDGWAPGVSLVDYLGSVPQPREVSYARYWHGYLVVLKPLLMLTTFTSIRVIASVLQLLLAGFVVMQCGKRKENELGAAFLLSVPFLYFFSMYFSLSLSICFYVMTIALLVQLKMHEKLLERGAYGLFFLIVGMATSYFDFLTYPIVTLGFPLCVCLYLNREEIKEALRKMIVYSAQWAAGYLGLWAMKWVLTDILTGGNTIADAVNTLFTRTDAAEGHSMLTGFAEVVKLNIQPYFNWPFYLLGLGIVLWLCGKYLKSRTLRFSNGLPICLVALYPFAWLFATQNHSQQHWMFTCKILSVSMFAVVCGVLAMQKQGDKSERKTLPLSLRLHTRQKRADGSGNDKGKAGVEMYDK